MLGFVSRDDVCIGHAVVVTVGASVRIMQTCGIFGDNSLNNNNKKKKKRNNNSGNFPWHFTIFITECYNIYYELLRSSVLEDVFLKMLTFRKCRYCVTVEMT